MSRAIPDGWCGKTLGDVVDLFNGKASGTGGSWLRVFKTRHVYDGFVRLSDPVFSPDDKASSVPKSTFLHTGDTLTPNMAHGTIGRVAFVREAQANWTVDGQVMVLRPKDGSVIGRYVFDWMSRPEAKRLLVNMEKGGAFDELRGQTHIYRTDVASIRILIPPLPEQRKIAAILSSVDDAIDKTRAVIDQLGVVKKAMMQELLTKGLPGRHSRFKQTEIGMVPEEWEVVEVGSVANVIDPQPDHRTPPAVLDGVPYVGMGDIGISGDINVAQARRVSAGVLASQVAAFDLHPGAFVFGKIGTIGKPTRLPFGARFALSANLIVLTTPDLLTIRFLYYALQAEAVARQIVDQTNTTSQPALGIKKVRAFFVGLPPPVERERVVDLLETNDYRGALEERKLDGLRSVKSALMSVLLTGEVRVTPDEVPA